jgi:hypothetical protein
VGPAGAFVSKTNYAAYIQDDWKITAKLTLNLGLRYDRFGFFEEMNKRSAKGDFVLGKIVIQHGSEANIQQAFQQYSILFVTSDHAGLTGTFVQPNNHDFTPRIGAAYRVTPTFVIRGGFGIYAVDVMHNSFTDQYNQPPFIYRAQLTRSLLISQNVNVNSLLNLPESDRQRQHGQRHPSAGGDRRLFRYLSHYEGLHGQCDGGERFRARHVGTRHLWPKPLFVVQVNACVPGPVQCLSRAANDPAGRRWSFFNTNFGQNTANGTSNFGNN